MHALNKQKKKRKQKKRKQKTEKKQAESKQKRKVISMNMYVPQDTPTKS